MDLNPFLERLRDLLPDDWTVTLSDPVGRRRGVAVDGTIRIRAPEGPEATLTVEAKARMSAQAAAAIASGARKSAPADRVAFTRYISPMARLRLREAGLSYLDLTGNTWIRIARPAVLIDRQGAETDPDPPRRGVRSLKGAKAARIVRSLCDARPPVGVRELARRTGTNPGYATRVLSLLEDDDLVVRDESGEVAQVRWPDLLRRWSLDYSVTETNRAAPYLAPRGLTELRKRLGTLGSGYAVTGTFAVPQEARVVSASLLSCYVMSTASAATALDLRPAESGANVLLIEPVDEFIFTGVRDLNGLRVVAPSQCVADLLTGSGRDPAQADALIDWMLENEDAWRA
jgi:hypothetical protein